MEKQPVGASDDARYAPRERVLVAAVVSQVAGVQRGRRVRRGGGNGFDRHAPTMVRGQRRIELRELRCSPGVGIERFRQESFIRRKLTWADIASSHASIGASEAAQDSFLLMKDSCRNRSMPTQGLQRSSR